MLSNDLLLISIFLNCDRTSEADESLTRISDSLRNIFWLQCPLQDALLLLYYNLLGSLVNHAISSGLYSITTVDGLMTERECELYEAKEMQDSKYWLPIQWAYLLARKMRTEDIITSDVLMNQILEKLREFRSDLQYLCCYDWVPVPLSYPQIVFLAVRCYFIVSLVARQKVANDNVDTYFPFMTVLEFLFTVGWMKVAEELLNPFGEDDDDFECNYLIDRNLSTGFEIVELHGQPPYDEIDDFWQMSIPRPLDVNVQDPEKKKTIPYHGSIADLNVLRDKSPNPRKNSVFSVTRDLSRRSKVADVERFNRSSRRQPSISTVGRLSSTNINNGIKYPYDHSWIFNANASFLKISDYRAYHESPYINQHRSLFENFEP
uniref:Bestrophin homolog n=1 Tax=Steinernema glaseri TaxID=37863 RepID=A0A1I7ZFR1_9BILA